MSSVQKDQCGGGCCKRSCNSKEQLIQEAKKTSEVGVHGLEIVKLKTAEILHKLIFKIDGMCCAAEVEILKRAVNPLIRGKDTVNLTFDLINAKLILDSGCDELPTKEQIIASIAKTGMTATLWKDHVKQMENATFWQKYGPITMNIISAIGLIIGTTTHAVEEGATAAFGGQVGDNETVRPANPPIVAIVFHCIAIVTGGWFIAPKAYHAIKRLRPDTNLLMTVASIGAVAINHWFEASSSMYLFSAAGLIEAWNVSRARKAISSLMELAPTTAQVVGEDGSISEQLVEQITIDTLLIVRPGEKISMDSIVTLGSTSVNQAPITGESMPVQKEVGDMLFAGTINGDGAIQCKVVKVASDSMIANIIRKVEEAQSKRAVTDQWIEKFSHYYVPIVIIASVIVAIVPPLASGNLSAASTWYPWVYKGLELLVISCPCSLVISTPVSIVAGLIAAARSGVLIKGGVYLETASHIKAFAMDKTGTLTNGEPVVQHIVPLSVSSEEDLLKLAVALEIHSDHPLARAIQRRAKTNGLVYEPAEDFQIFRGKGGQGNIDGKQYWIGSHRFLHERVGDNEPSTVHERIQELEAKGHSIVAVGYEQEICGIISIADGVRVESKDAIQKMKKVGIKSVVMLTGDNKGAAQTIAESIGIDECYAELLPEDKVKQVEELLKKYKKVAMVGDGINDAPAMAASSLAIAMGAAGSDAAIETADIALMSDDLLKLAWLVNHSRHTINVIKQNVVFSLAVKAIFAGLIFANKSTLWMAMISDIGATFIVVSNALRLVHNKSRTKRAGRVLDTLAKPNQHYKDLSPIGEKLVTTVSVSQLRTQHDAKVLTSDPKSDPSRGAKGCCSSGRCASKNARLLIDDHAAPISQQQTSYDIKLEVVPDHKHEVKGCCKSAKCASKNVHSLGDHQAVPTLQLHAHHDHNIKSESIHDTKSDPSREVKGCCKSKKCASKSAHSHEDHQAVSPSQLHAHHDHDIKSENAPDTKLVPSPEAKEGCCKSKKCASRIAHSHEDHQAVPASQSQAPHEVKIDIVPDHKQEVKGCCGSVKCASKSAHLHEHYQAAPTTQLHAHHDHKDTPNTKSREVKDCCESKKCASKSTHTHEDHQAVPTSQSQAPYDVKLDIVPDHKQEVKGCCGSKKCASKNTNLQD